MTGAQAPIGVFDSGLGGLSIVQEVRHLLPAEDLIYYADCAYCPYGTRPPAEIRERGLAIAGALVDEGAKLLVLACNTACAVVLPELRERFPVPIIGLEPAVKPATRLTRTKRVAVLATPRTVASERLANLIRVHGGSVEVRTVPAPGLVDLVEAGQVSGPEVERTLRPILEPLIGWDMDVLVLGCTHFPFLRSAIQRLVGGDVHVIDSGDAIARRTRDVLEERGLARPRHQRRGSLTLFTSGDPIAIAATSQRLLGVAVSMSPMPV